MLQQIRDKISGWFATVFLGAIAVVFVFWGIRFENSVDKAAATVNGEKIPLAMVRKAWQERQTELQQQLRGEIPPAVAKREQAEMIDGRVVPATGARRDWLFREFLWFWLRRVQDDPFTEEGEASAAVHLAFDHLDLAGVSLHGAGVVGQGQAGGDGLLVASDAGGE